MLTGSAPISLPFPNTGSSDQDLESKMSKSPTSADLVVRTLQISGRSDLSGGPTLMTRLLQGLSEHGFEHLVVCPDRHEGVNGILAKTPNVQLLNLPLRELRTQNPYFLFRAAQQFRPSLIHSHGKAAGLYSRALGKCLRIPVIHHYHGLHYRQYSA